MIGRTIAHYRILERLGAGGMGEVFRATDTRLGRDVALKVLPPETATSAARMERLLREAKALAAIDHPGIVSVYSVEESDHTRFITMQLVDGRSLDKAIPPGGLPAAKIQDIMAGLAEALAAAHARGVIHRDLKPANVMLTPAGGVKVLDFGLAKFEPASTPEPLATVSMITEEGMVLGTLPYMSPEQVCGSQVDERTDIYALGVIGYEMATGERPFAAPSAAELAAAVLREPPRALATVRPDLPARLREVITRCLAKPKEQRFGSAQEVLAALRAPAAETAGSSDASIAVLPFADMSPARDQEYFCEGMAEEIMSALGKVQAIRVAARTSAFRAHKEGWDLQRIAAALSVRYILEGGVRTAGNRLRVTAQLTDVSSGYMIWSERFDREATDVFAVQDEISAGVVAAVRTRLEPGPPEVQPRSQVKDIAAYREYLRGRHLRYTKNNHAAALQAFERAVQLDGSHAPSRLALAEVLVLVSAYALIPASEAYARAREAVAFAERVQGESAEGRFVEGTIALGECRWQQAESSWRLALSLAPQHVRALCWLASALAMRGETLATEELLRRARETDPLASYPYAMTALCMLSLGRKEEAEQFCRQALMFEEGNLLALWTLGVALVALERPDEAVSHLLAAKQRSPEGGYVHALLGWALAADGRTDEARAILELLRRRPAGAPPIVAEAWLLAELGDLGAAFEVLSRVSSERQAILAAPGSPAFDRLRADPRFPGFVRSLGLGSAAVEEVA